MPTIAERLADGNEFVFKHVYTFEAQLVQNLFEAYSQALREMEADLSAIWQSQVDGDTWGVTDIAARESLMVQITAQIDNLLAQSGDAILSDMTDAFYGSQYGIAYTLDQQIGGAFPDGVNIPLLPVEAVQAQLLAPYVGNTFVNRFADSRDEFVLRIRRSLVQSQIQGESINQAMRRIREELGIITDRRLKADRLAHRRNFNRVQMIARTELLRASNLGAISIYRANRDVLQGWTWLTAVDDRVCSICAPLDGLEFTFDGEPVSGISTTAQIPPPAHPQCRCTVVPTLLPEFRDLERAIAGNRATQDGPLSVDNFEQWRAQRGLSANRYGQVYDTRGRKAPQMELQ